MHIDAVDLDEAGLRSKGHGSIPIEGERQSLHHSNASRNLKTMSKSIDVRALLPGEMNRSGVLLIRSPLGDCASSLLG
jgi:hypothetical protein